MAGTLRDRIRQRLNARFQSEGISAEARNTSSSFLESSTNRESLRRERAAAATQNRDKLEADYKAKQDALKATEKSMTPKFGYGQATISAPSSVSLVTPEDNSNLSPKERALKDFDYRKNNREAGSSFRNFVRKELGGLGQFFFGESEQDMLHGKDLTRSEYYDKDPEEKGMIDTIRDDVKNRGIFAFLYQHTFMGDEESIKDFMAEGKTQGRTYEEAQRAATLYVQGKEDEIEDKDLLAHFKARDLNKKGMIAVELLDATPIISGFVKSAGKTHVRNVITEAMKAENAAQSRRIFEKLIPELKGTKELDSVVALTQTVKDPIKGEQLLREIMDTFDGGTAARATTEAQRLVYENGVPVLRGGRGAQNVDEIVNVRDEIRAAVKGEMEGRRLSGDDVLNDELRAGILKFGTTADSTVPVFTTRNTDKLSLGERVTLDPDVARKSLGAAGDAKEITAKVDDLVRLDDGTFVYAPKKAVTTEFSPQIKAVQDKMRQKTIDAEKRRTQLARDVKVAERQLAEADRRIARQQAEAVLKKEAEKLNIAKKTVETGVEELSKLKSQIDTETKATVKQRMTARKEASDTISAQRKQLNKLLKNLQKVREARKALPEEYRKKIEAIKSGKTKVRVGKEELPDDIQQLETEVSLKQDVVDSHPAKDLARYSARQGEFKGLLPEQKKDLDSAITEKSGGAYDSLEQARAGYQDYKTQKEVLSDMKAELREEKAAWKAEAKSRAGANLEKAKTKAINDLQAEKIAKSKELMKSEDGLKKGTEQLDEGIKAAEKANPDVGKTAAQIRKEVASPASAKKAQLTKNSKEQIAKAKNRLKEAGVETPKKAEKSSFEAARQWISGGNRRGMTKEVIEDLDAAGIKPKESMTLYRIGDVDSSEFQSWSKTKPSRGEEFTTKKFTPEEMLVDTTDPRFVSQFEGTNLEAIKKFNERESEIIIKAKERLTAKQVDTINEAKTSYKEGVKEVKQFENSIPDKPKRNFDPIESDGKKLSTKMNEDIARRTGYEEGIPKEYRQMSLDKDQQNAVQLVIEDVMDVYNRFIEGEDFSKATRASVGNALISHPQIASSPFRLDEVYRGLQGTRQAQEFVARRNIGDLDVVNFINNLNKRGEDILAKRGIDLKAEIEAAWKAAGLEKAKGQRAISKKSVEKVLKTNLC